MGITRGGNYSGLKWNRGGAKSRNQSFYIDFQNFAEYAERLESLGEDIERIFSEAMQEAAEKVQRDTIAAIASANLPAGGKYSRGETEKSVITDVTPQKQGSFIEVNLGFDKTVYGAGGFLITGTPKMRPDWALEDIYSRKKYAAEIKKKIELYLQDEIEQIMGG